MKLKSATQLAVIGIIIQLIPAILNFLANLNLIPYWVNQHPVWYMRYLSIPNLIGIALLLPFFITLFKSQK